MKTQINFLTVFLIAILFTGCTHYYYAPNMHNVPMLKEKNDTKFILALSSGDEFRGVESQFATAVTNKIGIMANYMSAKSVNNDRGETGNGSLFEFGGGYFKSIDQEWVFETYVGYGLGSVENFYNPGNSKVKFTRLFVQPSIGFTIKGFEIVLSSRLINLNYNKVDYNIQALDQWDIDDLEYIKTHKSSILLEPALTLRGGWKYVKIQVQYVLSSNINNKELGQEVDNANIGLYFSFPTKKQKN